MEMIWIDMGFHEKSPINISAHHSWGNHPTLSLGILQQTMDAFPTSGRCLGGCAGFQDVFHHRLRGRGKLAPEVPFVGGTVRMLCYLDKDTDVVVWIMSLEMFYDHVMSKCLHWWKQELFIFRYACAHVWVFIPLFVLSVRQLTMAPWHIPFENLIQTCWYGGTGLQVQPDLCARWQCWRHYCRVEVEYI